MNQDTIQTHLPWNVDIQLQWLIAEHQPSTNCCIIEYEVVLLNPRRLHIDGASAVYEIRFNDDFTILKRLPKTSDSYVVLNKGSYNIWKKDDRAVLKLLIHPSGTLRLNHSLGWQLLSGNMFDKYKLVEVTNK